MAMTKCKRDVKVVRDDRSGHLVGGLGRIGCINENL